MLTEAHLKSSQAIIINATEIEEAITNAFHEILQKIRKWQMVGSFWSVRVVNSLTLSIAKYRPFRGSSYLETPKGLKGSKKRFITRPRPNAGLVLSSRGWRSVGQI